MSNSRSRGVSVQKPKKLKARESSVEQITKGIDARADLQSVEPSPEWQSPPAKPCADSGVLSGLLDRGLSAVPGCAIQSGRYFSSRSANAPPRECRHYWQRPRDFEPPVPGAHPGPMWRPPEPQRCGSPQPAEGDPQMGLAVLASIYPYDHARALTQRIIMRAKADSALSPTIKPLTSRLHALPPEMRAETSRSLSSSPFLT